MKNTPISTEQTTENNKLIMKSVKTFKTKVKKLGTMTVKKNDELLVTDPCYTIPTWCTQTITNLKLGTFKADVVISNQGDFGERVKQIQIVHESCTKKSLNGLWRIHGNCGVDSGQLGMFIKSKYPQGDDTGEYDDINSFYGRCCNATLSDENCGNLPEGIVSSSGFGDGSYSCEIVVVQGEVVAVKVRFL